MNIGVSKFKDIINKERIINRDSLSIICKDVKFETIGVIKIILSIVLIDAT